MKSMNKLPNSNGNQGIYGVATSCSKVTLVRQGFIATHKQRDSAEVRQTVVQKYIDRKAVPKDLTVLICRCEGRKDLWSKSTSRLDTAAQSLESPNSSQHC